MADDYPHRMYHPTLAPPDNECDAYTEGQEAVYAEAGWIPVPAQAEPAPGYAAQPVEYEQDDEGLWAPKTDESAEKPARTRKAVKATDEQE